MAGIVSLFIWVFRDRIVNQFINQANTYLLTPVQVGDVEISLLRDFPNLSISLRNISVEDSHPGKFPLFTAKRVAFSFNLKDAWNGKYEVLALEIINSQTNIRYDLQGESNFIILKKNSRNAKQPSLNFNIQKATLSDATVSYNDEQSKFHHEFQTDRISASIQLTDDQYRISAKGNVVVGQLAFENSIFLPNKKFLATVLLNYQPNDQLITFMPSQLAHGGSVFNLEGRYEISDPDYLDVILKGSHTNIETIFSLLPPKYTDNLLKYESQANLDFELRLFGEPQGKQGVALTSKFNISEGQMIHPKTGFKLEQANLKGSFTAFGKSESQKTELNLSEASGLLNGKAFKGDFLIRNIQDPWIDMTFKGELDHLVLIQLIPDSVMNDFSGSILANVFIKGSIDDLKRKETVQRVKVDGELIAQQFSFSWGARHIPFRLWNGKISFDGMDLKMSDLKGFIGKSEMELSGQVRNLPAWLLNEGQPVGFDTKLSSNFLDIDQLLDFGFGQEDREGYKFAISPDLHLRFNYRVKSVKYRRFKATALAGDLLVRDQMAKVSESRFQSMGGLVELSGMVDARKKGVVGLNAGIKTKEVRLDSLFYVFEDFGQDFIMQKHLKGLMTSDIRFETDLDRALQLIPEKMIADASLLIKNGELNNFEPLQGLSKYLDDQGLRKLRFADLKNDIHIQDKTVFIPGMEIKSNLTTIQLSGKHTFDQKIDYRIVAPLSAKRKINRQEAGDAYVEEKGGKAKLFLKIIGTTDDYEITYDGAAVRQKIAGEFKTQVKSFRESLKTKEKEQQKKKAQLKEDDFFDWDNPR